MASASPPPAAPPTTWPPAHARFIRPKANPWSRPEASEASESSAPPGAQNSPSAATESTTAPPSSHTASGTGSSTAEAAAPASPKRIGRNRPRRSESRPTSGLITPSTAAAARKTAPIVTPLAPRSSRRSGTSTSITPENRAGRVKSQTAMSTPGFFIASPSSLQPALSARGPAGVSAATAKRAAATTAISENTSCGLVLVAAPPSTGPSSTPTMAAPSAEPISSPRRSRGVRAISQASPPAHVHAPPRPCTNRAESSTTMSFATPNVTLEPRSRPRPSSIVRLAPARPASQPAGSAPSRVPAA